MFYFEKRKKKVSLVKIILIIAGVAAGIAAIGTAIMFWKKNNSAEKLLEEEIEAVIEDAFAQEEADSEAVAE